MSSNTRTIIDDFGFEWRVMLKKPKTQLHWYLSVVTLVHTVPDGGFIRKTEEARRNLDKLAELKKKLKGKPPFTLELFEDELNRHLGKEKPEITKETIKKREGLMAFVH